MNAISKIGMSLLCLASVCACQTGTKDETSTCHTEVDTIRDYLVVGGKLYTSAWIQRSAEYQALCLQTYNLATRNLEDELANGRKGGKPWAIITDIDETILDNTPNSAHQSLKGEDYTQESWDEWCARAEADTLAGALDFFKKADAAGVKIFYISNREEQNRKGTLENLRKFGFPQLEDSQLLLKTETSDKTERRAKVLADYEIMMLLGDNLGDFEHLFDSSSEAERKGGVSKFAHEFGRRFIVLPNPNYGTWEKAINQGSYPSLPERSEILRNALKSY